ncbi:MAG: hypothetical protein ACLFPQ_03805 [Candidatus Woesearchaeota archaeon]
MKRTLFKILFILILLFSSYAATAENERLINKDFGLAEEKDNHLEFTLTNNRAQQLNIKLNVVDTYGFVKINFQEEVFELGPNEEKKISFSFDLSNALRKNPNPEINYSFQIIPAIVNKKDNSVLMMRGSSSYPVSPETIVVNFRVEENRSGFMKGLFSFIETHLINALIIIFLLMFLGYFSYQTFVTIKTKKIKKENIKTETKEKVKKERKKIKIEFPDLKGLIKNMKKIKPQKNDVQNISEIKNKLSSITEKVQKQEEQKEIIKESIQQNRPLTYEEIIRDFVAKNKADWTQDQWYGLLSLLRENKVPVKINSVKEDLETEKKRYVRDINSNKQETSYKETGTIPEEIMINKNNSEKKDNEIESIKNKLKLIQ